MCELGLATLNAGHERCELLPDLCVADRATLAHEPAVFRQAGRAKGLAVHDDHLHASKTDSSIRRTSSPTQSASRHGDRNMRATHALSSPVQVLMWPTEVVSQGKARIC